MSASPGAIRIINHLWSLMWGLRTPFDVQKVLPTLENHPIWSKRGEIWVFWDFLSIRDNLIGYVANIQQLCLLRLNLCGCLFRPYMNIIYFVCAKKFTRLWFFSLSHYYDFFNCRNIFLGENFSCYVSIHNLSSSACRNVTTKVMIILTDGFHYIFSSTNQQKLMRWLRIPLPTLHFCHNNNIGETPKIPW